jgi:hypothetical protein
VYSWLFNTFRLFRLYFVVEMLFGLWGLAGACMVFFAGWDQNVMLGMAITGGFLTALPAWSYLSRPDVAAMSRTETVAEPTETRNVNSPKAVISTYFSSLGDSTLAQYALILTAIAVVVFVTYQFIGQNILALVNSLDSSPS